MNQRFNAAHAIRIASYRIALTHVAKAMVGKFSGQV